MFMLYLNYTISLFQGIRGWAWPKNTHRAAKTPTSDMQTYYYLTATSYEPKLISKRYNKLLDSWASYAASNNILEFSTEATGVHIHLYLIASSWEKVMTVQSPIGIWTIFRNKLNIPTKEARRKGRKSKWLSGLSSRWPLYLSSIRE